MICKDNPTVNRVSRQHKKRSISDNIDGPYYANISNIIGGKIDDKEIWALVYMNQIIIKNTRMLTVIRYLARCR